MKTVSVIIAAISSKWLSAESLIKKRSNWKKSLILYLYGSARLEDEIASGSQRHVIYKTDSLLNCESGLEARVAYALHCRACLVFPELCSNQFGYFVMRYQRQSRQRCFNHLTIFNEMRHGFVKRQLNFYIILINLFYLYRYYSFLAFEQFWTMLLSLYSRRETLLLFPNMTLSRQISVVIFYNCPIPSNELLR